MRDDRGQTLLWFSQQLLLTVSLLVATLSLNAETRSNELNASNKNQHAVIEGVRVWRSPVRTRVVLDLSSPAQYKYFTLEGPLRFVLDLSLTKSQYDFGAIDTSGTPVNSIRGAARDKHDYRIVLDLAEKATPQVFPLAANERYGHRMVIDFYDEPADGNTGVREPVVTTVPDKDAKRDIIIAIDAGHGGEDPGALGPGKIREKRVVLEIAKELKTYIDKTPGYQARLIRTGDYYIALKRRRELAREIKADAFISVHADAFNDKRVQGSSVYTLSSDGASSASARFLASRENEADSIGGVPVPDDNMLAGVIWELSMGATMDSSANLADSILQAMKPVTKLHKSHVEHAGFAVLKSPDMPSVLLETGFISNPKEARKLANKKHQKRIASAVAQGVRDYFQEYAVEGTYVYWQKQSGNVERVYKIKSGDTLSEVAARYNMSVAKLKAYNRLKSDRIRVGQTIKIPPKT